MNLRDIIVRNARHHPRREAVIFENRRVTHVEFAERIFRLANGLLARGVRPQERIAVLAPNCLEYLEIFGACESANFIMVNLNHRLSVHELAAIGRDCEPSVLIFHRDVAALAEELIRELTSCNLTLCIGGVLAGAAPYEGALAASPTPPDVPINDSDIAYLIYTSGTTGRPKGVMLSHAAVLGAARCISHEGRARDSDVMLIVMPLFHIGGRIEQLAYTILGATILLHGSFDAQAILHAMQAEKVTSAHLAPIMIQRMLDSTTLASSDLSRLRSIHYASAPMPVPTLRRAIAAFGPILTQVYGMTECIVGSLLTPDQHVLDGTNTDNKRLASAGQPFLGCTICIMRMDGGAAATGEIGEVLIRGPGLMSGYWNNTTATVAATRDGWMHTGDLGYLDDDNFLFVVDRKKDMIISGGENIYSWEVEEALRSHPSVAEAAVIGVPDTEWGESIKAFVVTRSAPTPSAEELIQHCRALIASYKKPRSVEFVGTLPRLFNGKIDKKALRAPFWAAHVRQVS